MALTISNLSCCVVPLLFRSICMDGVYENAIVDQLAEELFGTFLLINEASSQD